MIHDEITEMLDREINCFISAYVKEMEEKSSAALEKLRIEKDAEISRRDAMISQLEEVISRLGGAVSRLRSLSGEVPD